MERIAVSVPEAAQMVGLSAVKMWQLVKSKDIPSVKLGASAQSTRRIMVEDLKEWMEKHKEV